MKKTTKQTLLTVVVSLAVGAAGLLLIPVFEEGPQMLPWLRDNGTFK